MIRLSSPALNLCLGWLLMGCSTFIEGSRPIDSDSADEPSIVLPTPAAVPPIRLGDRFFVSSVVQSVFGDNPVTRGLESTILKNLLIDFGPSCDRFGGPDNSCDQSPHNSRLSSISPATSSREAARLRICYEASASTAVSLRAAIANVKAITPSSLVLSGIAAPTAAEVQRAYNLFFPTFTPSGEVIEALLNLVEAADENSGNGHIEGWRFLFIALCSSPTWQSP